MNQTNHFLPFQFLEAALFKQVYISSGLRFRHFI